MAKPQSRKAKIPKLDIPGAVEASVPATLSPQLASLTSAIPNAGDWLYEIKLDGYRLMTRFDSGKPALITRNGHDWSAKMPVLVKELTNLGIESGWLDGEVVVLRDDGVPDFNAGLVRVSCTSCSTCHSSRGMTFAKRRCATAEDF
jgi:bifunctional non-homologous end joining protein LigD